MMCMHLFWDVHKPGYKRSFELKYSQITHHYRQLLPQLNGIRSTSQNDTARSGAQQCKTYNWQLKPT